MSSMALGCSECKATMRLVDGDTVPPIIKAANPMRGYLKSRDSLDFFVYVEDCDCGMKHTIHVVNDLVKKHVHRRGL